jgi:uncharacterized delta-60 repeat protein
VDWEIPSYYELWSESRLSVHFYYMYMRQLFQNVTIVLSLIGLLVCSKSQAEPGELDVSFEARWNSFSSIDQILVLPNDQFLISSSGFSLNADQGTSSRLIGQPLLKCNPDGSLDSSFVLFKGKKDQTRLYIEETPGALAVDREGGILIGGSVRGSNFSDVLFHQLVRFFADGSLDESFNIGSGPDGHLRVISPLSDGRIWIAGDFTQVHGHPASYLALLNQQGEFVDSFKVGEGFNKPVEGGFTDDLGRFVAMGKFDLYDGHPVNGLVRINQDGSLDASFDMKDSFIKKTAIMISGPDASLFVAEPFGDFGGSALPPIMKYDANGNADSQFNFGNIFDNRLVKHMALAPDDSHLYAVVGISNTIDRELRVLKIDSMTGEIDDSFSEGIQPFIAHSSSLHNHSDLGLLLNGDFREVNGMDSKGLVRIHTNARQNSAPTIRRLTGDQVLTSGDGLNLITSVNAYPKPTYQWYHNGVPLPSEDKPSLQRHFANASHQGSYRVVISNEHGSLTTDRMEVVVHRGDPGTIDHDYEFPSIFEYIEPFWVRAFFLQDDQRIVIAGNLQLQGQGDHSGGANGGELPNIVRILPSGVFDSSFDPGTGPDGSVDCVLVLPTEDLLTGGPFTQYNGIDCQGYAITSKDGQLLETEVGSLHGNIQQSLFNLGAQHILSGGIGPNDEIYLGGKFKQGDQVQIQVIRLLPDGTLDSSFTPWKTADGSFLHHYSHPDHSLWIFDGSRQIWHLDAGSNILHGPDQSEDQGPRSFLTKFYATSNGDTLISGIKSSEENAPLMQRWESRGQFNPDFPVFSPELRAGDVTSLALSSDESIYIGRLNGNSPNTLLRLTSLGNLDDQFVYTKYGSSVYNFVVLPDGDLIVLGDFPAQSGVRSSLARIVGFASSKTIKLQGQMVENRIQIRFNSIPGFSYRVLSKSSLKDAEWQPVADLTSSGYETQFLYEKGGHPYSFFRVTQMNP